MNKFKWNDTWVGDDKFLHCMLCYILVILFSFFIPLSCAFFTTVVIALLKELLYDMLLEKGTPSLQDFIVSVVGATIAYGMLI